MQLTPLFEALGALATAVDPAHAEPAAHAASGSMP